MDPKSKQQLTIIAALVPVLLFFVTVNLIGPMMRRTAPAAAPAPEAGTSSSTSVPIATVSPAISEARLKKIAELEGGAWSRNPFLPPQVVVAAPTQKAKDTPPAFSLEGIVYDSKNPYAIINGEVRVKGDKVLFYTITEISQDAVTLEKDGRSLKLKLFPEVR